jgi:hypothetical protein
MANENGGSVNVGEVVSTVSVTDSQALLNPQVLEKIVQIVLSRMKEHDRHLAATAEERKMRPSMTAREAPVWEG